MCYISLGRKVQPIEVKDYNPNGCPVLIDGVDVINTLAPVSKKTGMRENLLTLVRKLVNDPAKQALLYQVIQELPTDNSQANLDEASKFDFCAQRLETGTPAENEKLLDSLQYVLDLHLDAEKAAAAQQTLSQSGIKFDGNDANAAAAASGQSE